ncbi:hypothetical protein GCM10007049_17880 [Echinicola pacifica]|uniref:DinB-like domain-containing protein n=1 Tax=Echinicola pacifica TaxID=346377 RepID=A0A918UQ09_9BACT|nr:DinB family protein [Echinicola pacifica]GGZ25748.1 hypothetical protein GCM10007049_17880 [Echinicola pacifica]
MQDLQAWQSAIRQNTKNFTDAFMDLEEEALFQQTTPNQWSIGEIIQHISLINKSYFPIFQEILDGQYHKPFIGKISFLTKALGNTILKSVQPDNPKKVKTVSLWDPSKTTTSLTKEQLWEDFLAQQALLIDWADLLLPALNRGQVIHSPANRLIAYPLQTALHILEKHEQRHFQQAMALRSKLVE